MGNRTYAQYADKPNITKWLDILPSQSLSLYDTVQLVRTSYDIDSATSYELDVIGNIVAQPRNYETEIVVEMLQLGQSSAQLGGTVSQLRNSTDSVSQDVSDDIYRILIRAKISKNSADGTIDSILKSASFITGVDSVVLLEGADMSFGLNFIDGLTAFQRFMIQTFPVIPKPQGVRFLGFTEELGRASLGVSQLQSTLLPPETIGSGATMGGGVTMTGSGTTNTNRITQLTEYF